MNAHGALSRRAARDHLARLAALPTATENDRHLLILFDLFYSQPCATVLMQRGFVKLLHQTRALDQGCGISAPVFNSTFSTFIATYLAKHWPRAFYIGIHDDFNLVARSGLCSGHPW